MEENCIFCKISFGILPSTKVYEDEKVLALLDINPVSKGHTLIIPKFHHTWMQDVPDKLIADLFVETKKIMKSMINGLHCDYVQVSVVGKDVPHFHIHLIPRYHNDNFPNLPIISYIDEIEKEDIANKIKNSL